MHRICLVWRVRRSWFLCQDLYDSTEQPLYNPRSSVILGHPRSSSPRLDLDTIGASVQCTEAREESHVARHRARRARTRRLQRLLGRPRLEISQDISGFLTISGFLGNGGTAWQCKVWIGLGMFGGIGYLKPPTN